MGKKILGRYNGLIEGDYYFAGYEGKITLYKKTNREQIPKYFVEATLKANAMDYVFCARHEGKIWGQHPFLTDSDTLFFEGQLLQPPPIEMKPDNLFKLLQIALSKELTTYVGYDRFYFERVLYVLGGNISLLENPIIVAKNAEYRNLEEAAKTFDFQNEKSCILEKVFFTSSKSHFFNLYFRTKRNNILIHTSTEPKTTEQRQELMAAIMKRKRPEIKFPY
jgi:hypothetical protein